MCGNPSRLRVTEGEVSAAVQWHETVTPRIKSKRPTEAINTLCPRNRESPEKAQKGTIKSTKKKSFLCLLWFVPFCLAKPPLIGDNTSFNIVIMIRTQISLSEREYRAAKAEAARLGISLAELLRQ